MEAFAIMKNVPMSAQKMREVTRQVQGLGALEAMAVLQIVPRKGARLVSKVLRSAIANAQNKDGFSGDVDNLYVSACYANQGPAQKRVRPAPMGRAFRVLKRTAHLTVHVSERPEKVVAIAADSTAKDDAAPKRARRTPAAKKPAAAKRAPAKKSTKK